MKLKDPALVLSLTVLALPTSASATAPDDHPLTVHGPAFEDTSTLLQFDRVDELTTAKLGGTAMIDYDDDDDLDIYVVNAPGGDNALFRNDGGTFTNVATAAGVAGDGSGYTGALAGDIDNDGCTDLFLTGGGAFFGAGLPHRLYLNNCDGTFADVTTVSGIDPTHLGLMAAFGDIDDDGLLDLFVASPGNFLTGTLTTQKLYHNDGDGTFTDISMSAGIDTARGGCVAAFSDFNEDGLSDIVVGNCNNLDTSVQPPARVAGPWELWINQGDLTFVDEAAAAGLDVRPGFPMGVTLGDYDGDGDLDMFATGTGVDDPFGAGRFVSQQVLFENQGDGTFADATFDRGLGGFELGWGASFGDFDNDGDEDLVSVGSLAVAPMPILGDMASPGRVMENDGTGQMSAALDFGLQNQATSGLAVGDYDGDGFSDVVIVKTAYDLTSSPSEPLTGDGAPVLLRNEGNDNNSVTLRLVGSQSNAMGVGARVEARAPDGEWQVRELAAGSSFASTNSPWLTFGLGHAHVAFVDVYWPSGIEESFVVPALGGVVRIEEGTGVPL